MTPTKELDLSGEPETSRLLELNEFVGNLSPGEVFALTFSDPDFLQVVELWCDRKGHELVTSETTAAEACDAQCYAMIRKAELVES